MAAARSDGPGPAPAPRSAHRRTSRCCASPRMPSWGAIARSAGLFTNAVATMCNATGCSAIRLARNPVRPPGGPQRAARHRNDRSTILYHHDSLPSSLHAQAFGEVAAEHVLAEMTELAIEVDPDLAADVAPAAAERIVLRQVATRIRICHAVEEPPVQMRLRIVGRPIWRVFELRIAVHQHFEYMALDDHESGRRFRHLDEGFRVHM